MSGSPPQTALYRGNFCWVADEEIHLPPTLDKDRKRHPTRGAIVLTSDEVISAGAVVVTVVPTSTKKPTQAAFYVDVAGSPGGKCFALVSLIQPIKRSAITSVVSMVALDTVDEIVAMHLGLIGVPIRQ